MNRAERRGASDQVTDAELFRGMASGDLGPLGLLFDRHHEDVRQFLLRACPGAADVDDLAQETFLTAAKAAESYDGREVARPFLIGIAVRLLRRRHRSSGRYRGLLERFGLSPPEPPRTPEQSTSLAEAGAELRAAIARLSEDRRLALVMVEYSGLSGVEVARALDVPVGTVWRRLHEARAELRRALDGGTP